MGDSLLAAGLIDTLRLVIAPTSIRSGRRLFTEGKTTSGFRMTHHEATPKGLLIVEYEPEGQAARDDYEGVADLI